MYGIEFSENAVKELSKMKKSDAQAYKKFERLIPELQEHPQTGTGKPERLKNLPNMWSRRLGKKNRLLYTIDEDVIVVCVVSAMGHYNDK